MMFSYLGDCRKKKKKKRRSPNQLSSFKETKRNIANWRVREEGIEPKRVREKMGKRGIHTLKQAHTFFLPFLALILSFPQPQEPLFFLSQFFLPLTFYSLFLKCKKGVNEKEIHPKTMLLH
jgi:hypothetical protein